MSLAQLQKDLGTVLWGSAGSNSLQTARQWKTFLGSPQGLRLSGFQRKQLSLYESLLKNTVEETLSTFFPFCKSVLGAQWAALAEQYRRTYPNRSYLLYQCAKDFPEFISTQKNLCADLPFLPELALFEWLEVAVENAPHQALPASFQDDIPNTLAELSAYQPIWNPDADLRTWQYPIPTIIEALSQLEAGGVWEPMALNQSLPLSQPITLFIYRDSTTYRARFFELNALTGSLIQLSAPNKRSYHDLFCQLKETFPSLANVPMDSLMAQGLGLIKTCYQENMIVGSCPYATPKEATS
jgi:hypothetical protein